MVDSAWKSLDTAPRQDAHGKPVPVLLFLPSAFYKVDRDGRPTDVSHARVVGWWDDAKQCWVTGFNPSDPTREVYPSLWADLPADPLSPPAVTTAPIPADAPVPSVAAQAPVSMVAPASSQGLLPVVDIE